MTTQKQPELQKAIYHNEEAARAHFEKVRWPDGRSCFHCGSLNSTLLAGKTSRPGLYQCNDCRGQFTAVMGTVFEGSHIPLHRWLMATHLLCSSKKGMSALQLHRELGSGSYRTAWFMAHRIREAMAMGPMQVGRPPMGGDGGIIEADETYFGQVDKSARRTTRTSGKPFKRGKKAGGGPSNKRAVVALVERGGSVRSFHVGSADKYTVTAIIKANISASARLMTDESRLYADAIDYVVSHETVKHSAGEYARGDVNTNSVEGYFSVFKRGMKGVYQHCAEKHLQRYLAEFDFRHNSRTALGFNDSQRTDLALKGTIGKRLTYRRIGGAELQAAG